MKELTLFRMRYQNLEARTCNSDGTQNPPHTCVEVILWHKGIPNTLASVYKDDKEPRPKINLRPTPAVVRADRELIRAFVDFAVDLMDKGTSWDTMKEV